jgi:hypothetical protein
MFHARRQPSNMFINSDANHDPDIYRTSSVYKGSALKTCRFASITWRTSLSTLDQCIAHTQRARTLAMTKMGKGYPLSFPIQKTLTLVVVLLLWRRAAKF